ncbi:MAG: CHAT domain-containing tetratricopeptide repeat protein [Rhodothermales bacterium]|nr:CHAT domain-containing tetratricopeptide repeat protein [Rhodothermales bacterium]
MPPALVLLRVHVIFSVLLILFVAGCRESDREGNERQPLLAIAVSALPDTMVARLLLAEAGDWLLAAEYDSAWPPIVRAKQLYAGSPQVEGQFETALLEGRFHLDQGRFNDAYALVDSALTSALPVLGEYHPLVADAYDILGNSSRVRGDLDAVERHFFDALRIRETLFGAESPRVAESHHHIGLYHHLKGDLEQAKAHYEQRLALTTALSVSDSMGIARTHNNLASIYSNLGNIDLALASHQQALQIRLAVLPVHHNDMASTYHNLGNVYLVLHDYEQSLRYFQQAITIREVLFGKTHIDIAGGYYSIARVHIYEEKYDRAIEYLDHALATLDTQQYMRHPLMHLIFRQKSSAQMKLGHYDEAEALLQQSSQMVQAQYGQDHPDMIQAHLSLGLLHEEKGDMMAAMRQYEEAHAMSLRSQGDRRNETAVALLNMASVYRKLGKKAQAVASFERALGILEARGTERRTMAQAINELGAMQSEPDGDPDEAMALLQRAIYVNVPAFGDQNHLSNPDIRTHQAASEDRLFDTLVLKAGVLTTLFDREGEERYVRAAYDAYRQAGYLVQAYLRELSTEASQLAWVERTHVLYEPAIGTALRMFRLTGDAGYQEAAFAFAEQSRGRVLASSITAARARHYANIPDSLLEREEDIRLRLTYYTRSLKEEEGQLDAADSARVTLWKGKVFALKREYEALIAGFESAYPAYFKLKHQTTTASLADIQAALHGTEDTLVEYFVGADSLYAFAVTAASVDVTATAIDSTLADDVETLRTAIVDRNTAAFAETGHRLYQQLVAPLAPFIRGTHVTIVPDAFLSQLPFETLLSAPAAGGAPSYTGLRYLLDSYSISYAYSSTLYVDTRVEHPPAARNFVAFAPVFMDELLAGTRGAALLAENLPAPDGALNRGFLPATFDEVKSIEKLFVASRGWLGALFGGKTRVFLEEQATEASIREALRDYRFVHLATHAFVSEDDPLLSGIVLLDDTTGGHDGVLELAEIYNLDLNAELVTLSACQTGLGRQMRGEGLVGLTRGFLFAGARNVLVSLWNVQDQTTARLMTHFYEGVLAGLPKGEALRDAKRRLIASSDHLADPFYWSPFVLNGR